MNTKSIIISGRPRLSIDFAIVLRMRDEENLGWSQMAKEYRRLTGEYVSRDTMKRRYLEARLQKDTTANGRIDDVESQP